MKSKWLLIVAAALVMLIGISVVQAQEDDGRINRTHHLGGAVVYCVTVTPGGEKIPSGSWIDGGILVTDSGFNELFFVDADAIAAGNPPLEENVLIGSGGGFSLYRLKEDGIFQLNGFDEHGKLFEFMWRECDPVSAPTEPEPTEPEPDPCPEIQEENPRFNGVTAFGEPQPEPDPCFDPCEEQPPGPQHIRFGIICEL